MQIVDGEIAQLVIENDRLIGVELTDGRMIARTAVFIRPGNVPHADGLLAGLGCDLMRLASLRPMPSARPAPSVSGQPGTWSIAVEAVAYGIIDRVLTHRVA